MNRAATVALAQLPAGLGRSPSRDLDLLRRRLSATTARELVVVDFLEDDLRDAEAALAELQGWLGSVFDAIRDARAGRAELLALAARLEPEAEAERVGDALGHVRRRLTQVAAGLERAERGNAG